MSGAGPTPCAGLLLAAGAGVRYGQPKALVVYDGHPLVNRAVESLVGGGCDPIYVVLGAAAEEVRRLLPSGVIPVFASNWRNGMGESLKSGIEAISGDAVLIHLVDLPDVGAEVIERMRGYARPEALCRASYHGIPGHPVIVGRKWWRGFTGSLSGDEGAKRFLHGRASLVECSDLATGVDLDFPLANSNEIGIDPH